MIQLSASISFSPAASLKYLPQSLHDQYALFPASSHVAGTASYGVSLCLTTTCASPLSAMLISCQKETTVLTVETGIPDQSSEASSIYTQTESTSVHQDEIVNSFPESFNSQIGNCQFSIDSIDSPRDVVFHPRIVSDALGRRFQDGRIVQAAVDRGKETGKMRAA